jgi:hypothetical protein
MKVKKVNFILKNEFKIIKIKSNFIYAPYFQLKGVFFNKLKKLLLDCCFVIQDKCAELVD